METVRRCRGNVVGSSNMHLAAAARAKEMIKLQQVEMQVRKWNGIKMKRYPTTAEMQDESAVVARRASHHLAHMGTGSKHRVRRGVSVSEHPYKQNGVSRAADCGSEL